MLTIREALGGKWATNPIAWTILLVPATLLVALQESSTPFPSFGLVLASALAQHVAGAITATIVAVIIRRRRPIIPIPASYFIWAILGATRGWVAGLFAAAFTNVDPDYFYRIVSWVAIAVIWMPLFTYAIAQFDLRRGLLLNWSEASRHLEAERSVSGLSATDLRAKLIAAVKLAIGPVLDDIRQSLVALSAGSPDASLSTIRFRLALVARDAAQIVDPVSDEESMLLERPRKLALISLAADFDQSRPFFVSVLTTVALAPLLLPDSIRVGGFALGGKTLVALLVAMVFIAATLSVLRWWRNRSFAHLVSVACIGFLVSGLSASAAVFVMNIGHLVPRELVLILTFPVGVFFAMSCISGAVGLAIANIELEAQTTGARAEASELHKTSEETVTRVSQQVNELMHGPIQGRLAACAMALNFHATSANANDPEKVAAVTASVLNHLELVSRDLNEMSMS